MNDARRAIEVISETPTDYGYVIRVELWPGTEFHVEPMGDSPEVGADIQDINEARDVYAAKLAEM